MLDKIFSAQQKAEEVKKRLDGIMVTGSAESGKITVSANGNKIIQSITIEPVFLQQADREALEELLVVAINKALAAAEEISQTEMTALSREMLGGLGGFFGK